MIDYNDGLPMDSNYVLGIDEDTDNIPTHVSYFDKHTGIEFVNFLYVPRLGNSIVRKVKPKQTANSSISVEDNDEYLQGLHDRLNHYTDIEESDQYTDFEVPLPKINTAQVDIPLGVRPDNLVDIPIETLKRLTSTNKQLTKEVSDIILQQGSSALISFDAACAYAETTLRDGLRIQAKIDSDVTIALNGLLKLSIINKYLSTFDLPSDVRSSYLSKLTELVVTQNHEDMRKYVNGQRHSTVLNALAGRVATTNQQANTDKSSIGVGKGRSGKYLDSAGRVVHQE